MLLFNRLQSGGKVLFGGVWGDAAVVLQGIGVNDGGSKSQTSCGVLGSNSVGVFGVAPDGVRGCILGETGSCGCSTGANAGAGMRGKPLTQLGGMVAVAGGEPSFAFIILASCTLSHFSVMFSSLVHSHGKS